MIRSKWGFVLMFLVLGLTLVGSGCDSKGPAKANEQVIKIGFIGPLNGDVKTFGESTKNAFNLAIEQAGGKVGDYKIETVPMDDRNDATEAVNVATKLITQYKVKAIVGSVTSKTTIPISQVANDNKVVMITGTATNPIVTVDNNKRKDFAFRACFIDPFQGTVAAKFATDTLKAKTAAILYDQYNIGLANYFKDNFTKAGGQVLASEAYSQGDLDFSAFLTKIAKQNPDILYLPDYCQKVSLIGKQAREKGIKAIFLGGSGWDSKDLDYTTMEGGYFTNHYSTDDPRPEVKKWVEDYKVKYGSVPDASATLCYDGTKLLLNAIKTANSDDPVKIKEALQATKDFSVVSGKITFEKDGNPIKPVAILQVKGGKYSCVTTVVP